MLRGRRSTFRVSSFPLCVSPSLRLSICPSVCLSMPPYVCLSFHVTTYSSLCPSIRLSFQVTTYLSLYPFMWPSISVRVSIDSPVCLFILSGDRLSLCLSIPQCVRLFFNVGPNIYPSVCLSILSGDHLSVHVFLYSFRWPSIYPFVCPSIPPCVRLAFYVTISPSVCPSMAPCLTLIVRLFQWHWRPQCLVHSGVQPASEHRFLRLGVRYLPAGHTFYPLHVVCHLSVFSGGADGPGGLADGSGMAGITMAGIRTSFRRLINFCRWNRWPWNLKADCWKPCVHVGCLKADRINSTPRTGDY